MATIHSQKRQITKCAKQSQNIILGFLLNSFRWQQNLVTHKHADIYLDMTVYGFHTLPRYIHFTGPNDEKVAAIVLTYISCNRVEIEFAKN